jgi:uncharacterized protein (DUF488 family)
VSGTGPGRESGAVLITVGHGALALDAFVSLLEGAGVRRLVDVRAYPGSRRHPWFGRESLASLLPAAGIAYEWEPALGGRRRPRPDSRNPALRDPGLRGYADHMQETAFWDALGRLLARAAGETTACMCSESHWTRCHRRLIADAAVLVCGVRVRHLLHDGSRQDHVPTAGARRAGNRLLYDAGQPPLPGQAS